LGIFFILATTKTNVNVALVFKYIY